MDFGIQNAIESVGRLELPSPDIKVKIIGVGGAGSNIVSWLYKKQVHGAEIIAVNTDRAHLCISDADKKILIGFKACKSNGCGGLPSKGKDAVNEDIETIKEILQNVDLVFIIAGFGGGTGTGVSPVIAKIAKEQGSIVLGIAVTPFKIERSRVEKAVFGLQEFKDFTDSVIIIDNNKLNSIAGNLPLQQAFAIANEVISNMVKNIVETITLPSFMNLGLADLKSIMSEGGVCAIGVGESDSEHRVEEAVEMALKNPFFDIDYNSANGALIHVEAGNDVKLSELEKVNKVLSRILKNDVNIIWGSRINPTMGEKLKIMTLISGVKSPNIGGIDDDNDMNWLVDKNLGLNKLFLKS